VFYVTWPRITSSWRHITDFNILIGVFDFMIKCEIFSNSWIFMPGIIRTIMDLTHVTWIIVTTIHWLELNHSNGLSWEYCGLSWVLCGLFWVEALTYIMGQFWRLCCFRVKPKPALIFLVTNNVSTADRGKPSGEITSSESQG